MKQSTSTAKFDAELTTDPCDRYNNAELTVTLKICLRQVNPAGGKLNGTHHDYGDATAPARKIVQWSASAWSAWKSNFIYSAERFWTGKFWLVNDFGMTPKFTHCFDGKTMCVCHKSLDFEDKGVRYRPNIWCRFKLKTVNAPADANHTIDVVRLHSSESWFGSHSTLYDSKDTNSVPKGTDSKGKDVMQRAHVHEIGHLLGLPHVDEGKPHCPTTGNTNASACYGITDNDMNDAMGSGMALRSWHSKPWREAIIALTGSGLVANANDWKGELERHYPRTMSEVASKSAITKRPARG